MTRDEWLDLAKRCEEAKGADREIDVEIALAIDLHPPGLEKLRNIIHLWGTVSAFVADLTVINAWTRALPKYTDSLDALAGLAKTVLPGCTWHISNPDGFGRASLWGEDDVVARGLAASPPLALCAAFCRAMAERTPK